jgi:hypothetical protein
MLDKLTAIGADGARSITFSGNGNKNGLDEGFDFTNLSIEPLSQKQTKAMQNFFDNLDPMVNLRPSSFQCLKTFFFLSTPTLRVFVPSEKGQKPTL